MRLFTNKIMLLSGVFRRETASCFYPWGKVEGPRKRAAEGLCGWRHGHSFPMTQSAQSHSQMRSIPHCSKAVFYVFVFDYIHDSATIHNLSPGIFHWTIKWLNRLWADVNYLIFTLDCSMMGAKWVGEDFMESDNFINFEKSEYSILHSSFLNITN